MTKQNPDIAIIGGGLSGLALAAQLQKAGADWQLYEARPRFGGRVLSAGATHADMGPGWTWPGDRRVTALAAALDISLFPQFATGKLVFEDPSGTIRRDLDMALMAGARRVEGGVAALTDALRRSLPGERLHSGAPVTAISLSGTGYDLTIPDTAITAAKTVLALPPRVALHSISGLAALTSDSAKAVPTWMAGQAKAVAIYDHPFWRDAGLSGEAISHRGPLAQIHDASPMKGPEGALIGFLATRPATEAAITAQLTALFGPDAAAPREVLIQDWAPEAETTSDADRAAPGQPQPHMAHALRRSPTLIWAGAEAAVENTGLLEGALAAADHAAALLIDAA